MSFIFKWRDETVLAILLASLASTAALAQSGPPHRYRVQAAPFDRFDGPRNRFLGPRDRFDPPPDRFYGPSDGLPPILAARNACIADVRRLCSDVIPGRGRIISCLIAKPEALSPLCREAIQAARAATRF